MTIHVSGVSLAGGAAAGFFGAAFGACAQGAGYSPPRMSPGLRPPPLFRGGEYPAPCARGVRLWGWWRERCGGLRMDGGHTVAFRERRAVDKQKV